MKIAVTAVSGRLGGEIAQALISMHGADDTHDIIGLARTPAKAKGLGIEVRPGDYGQPEQLATSLSGVDSLVLVSGMAPPDERVEHHRNVIEAARSAGVKKIVFTSIQGLEEGTGFSPVVQSSRQTEADVGASGMDWVIGRNGIYIEPEVEYIETFKKRGEIENSAGDGRCGFTTRKELGFAYAQLVTDAKYEGKTYNLHGEPISQEQLAGYLNRAFGTELRYRPISAEAYRANRIEEHGPFIGAVIAGIYEGIQLGALDVESDYEAAAGRPHVSWDEYFEAIRSESA